MHAGQHRTSANTSVTIIDLMPSTTYYVSLRSHPASEPTIAWAPGWRPLSASVSCTTAPAPVIFGVNRAGGLAETSISITFHVDTAASMMRAALRGSVIDPSNFDVGVVRMPSFQLAESMGAWDITHDRYTWLRGEAVVVATQDTTNQVADSSSAMLSANISGLEPASTYFVVVRMTTAENGTTTPFQASDPEMMRTASQGMLYTVTHRISEYAMDVDFLENHDSASVEAMPLYFMT